MTIVSRKIYDNRVVVVDDFYADPYAIREIALLAEYEEKNTGNYPGCNSITKFWSEDITQRISQITGDSVDLSDKSYCGKFRFVCKHDVARIKIHSDSFHENIWAGVIYLNLPEHCDGTNSGTTMYRHKASGLSTVPLNPIEAQKIGVSNYEDFQKFVETEGVDKSLWSPELRVDNKFNRLVLFRPWMWHSMEDHFGSDVTNSRLTQLVFLNKK